MKFGIITQYILFGGGTLLGLTAQKLARSSTSVLVVTSKRHIEESITIDNVSLTLKTFLEGNHFDFIVSPQVSEDTEVIGRINKNTLGISFGAAWIFKKPFIDLFEGRLLNCHGTKLPQDRGGGGYSWRIMRSDRCGVSLIHQVTPGVDTGDVVLYDEYIFPPSCRLPIDFQQYSIEKYRLLLDDFFNRVGANEDWTPMPQQEYFSAYWPRLATDIHGYIDWSWDLQSVERFICAFDDPYNGASTFVGDRKVRLKKCEISYTGGSFHPFQDGVIYRKSAGCVFVAKREGSLLVGCVLDEMGNDITDSMKLGDRFNTPAKYLDEAKKTRAFYTPEGLK